MYAKKKMFVVDVVFQKYQHILSNKKKDTCNFNSRLKLNYILAMTAV